MLKALIPYMDSSVGSQIAMVARIMEMRNTMDFFNNPQTLEACGIGTRRPEPEDLLRDIRKYVDGPEADSIDMILNFMRMNKFYDKFKDLENIPEINNIMSEMRPEFNQNNFNFNNDEGDGNDNLFNNLKSMLTPEQLQMFETINAMNRKS